MPRCYKWIILRFWMLMVRFGYRVLRLVAQILYGAATWMAYKRPVHIWILVIQCRVWKGLRGQDYLMQWLFQVLFLKTMWRFCTQTLLEYLCEYIRMCQLWHFFTTNSGITFPVFLYMNFWKYLWYAFERKICFEFC